MARRSGKFYRNNEREVMERLGLSPTMNSGSGWLQKEDGESDSILCQLKSTDAESITVKQHDLHTLEYNALVSHKVPVFALQFLGDGQVWLMIRPENLQEAAKALNGTKGSPTTKNAILDDFTNTGISIPDKETIQVGSDYDSRKKFNEMIEKEREQWQQKRRKSGFHR